VKLGGRGSLRGHRALCLGVIAGLLAAALPARSGGQPTSGELQGRGRWLYGAACATCHHGSGNGAGPAARHLAVAPTSLAAGSYKFTSTPAGGLPTGEDLDRTIARGVPGTMMPGFEGLLTEPDRRAVAAYLMSLTPAFARWGVPDSIAVAPEPEDVAASAAAGQQLFVVMECYACHGVDGRGRGPQSEGLKDDEGHAIRPRDFTTGWFKSGGEPVGVYKAIHTGLNGTPMVAYGDALLLGGDSVTDLAPYATAYDPVALEGLRSWLSEQPLEAELSTMARLDLEGLVGDRVWHLVHYVQSMKRPRNPLLAWLLSTPDQTE